MTANIAFQPLDFNAFPAYTRRRATVARTFILMAAARMSTPATKLFIGRSNGIASERGPIASRRTHFASQSEQ